MIVDDTPFLGAWNQPIDDQPECEFCGRSMLGRFGGMVPNECDSCAAEFALLDRAGKLEMNGWAIEVVKCQ